MPPDLKSCHHYETATSILSYNEEYAFNYRFDGHREMEDTVENEG